MGYPSIVPTGTTIYNKEKAFNGYTVFPSREGALLIDMNGRELKLWKGLQGFPNKLLPGGQIFGSSGVRNPKYGMQDQVDLLQVDWGGNIVWKFDRLEYIEDEGEEARWMARQHHDFQREGSSTGYYAPGSLPLTDGGNTLILVHENVRNSRITDKLLLDDKIIEVNWEGEIIWSWNANEHFNELGFDESAKNILARDPNLRPAGGGMGDWLHINSVSALGENQWYDGGDERFHPDNIIWDSREANILAIISKQTGNIVWRLGPDFNASKELIRLGWIIGQHHLHMIPRNLPGEGNLLVFDNGGWGGYGAPNPTSPTGRMNAKRDYSRVLEFNPITLEVAWQYTPAEAGFVNPLNSYKFYSPFISSAQRLPNGNTLITEGSDGRLIEVTPSHEIVWEYINPYYGGFAPTMNMIYRAYRAPYDWVPQLPAPKEVSIEKTEVSKFRVPGSVANADTDVVEIAGIVRNERENEAENAAFCVLSDTDRSNDK